MKEIKEDEIYLLEKVFSSFFESPLLKEIEEKSMLIKATPGQAMIATGQTAIIDPVTAE